MIKDAFTGEVIDDYELVDDWDYYCDEYSKLLNKENIEYRFNYKRTKDCNVHLVPYSELFTVNFYSNAKSFNNKKFSII